MAASCSAPGYLCLRTQGGKSAEWLVREQRFDAVVVVALLGQQIHRCGGHRQYAGSQ